MIDLPTTPTIVSHDFDGYPSFFNPCFQSGIVGFDRSGVFAAHRKVNYNVSISIYICLYLSFFFLLSLYDHGTIIILLKYIIHNLVSINTWLDQYIYRRLSLVYSRTWFLICVLLHTPTFFILLLMSNIPGLVHATDQNLHD